MITVIISLCTSECFSFSQERPKVPRQTLDEKRSLWLVHSWPWPLCKEQIPQDAPDTKPWWLRPILHFWKAFCFPITEETSSNPKRKTELEDWTIHKQSGPSSSKHRSYPLLCTALCLHQASLSSSLGTCRAQVPKNSLIFGPCKWISHFSLSFGYFSIKQNKQTKLLRYEEYEEPSHS